MPSSRGSSRPRDGTQVSRTAGGGEALLVPNKQRALPWGPGGEDATLPPEEARVPSPVGELRSPRAARLGQNIKTNKHATTKTKQC